MVMEPYWFLLQYNYLLNQQVPGKKITLFNSDWCFLKVLLQTNKELTGRVSVRGWVGCHGNTA